MSQEDVEIVRRIYREGLIDRDPKRFVADFAAPGIEYVNPPEAVELRTTRVPVATLLRRPRAVSTL
jgi:hypothetical protein